MLNSDLFIKKREKTKIIVLIIFYSK